MFSTLRLTGAVLAGAILLAPAAVRAEPYPKDALKSIDPETTAVVNLVIVFTQLSGVYDDAGEPKLAARALDEAIAAIDQVKPGLVKDWLINKTGNKLAHSYAADKSASLRQFDKAVAMADTITDHALAAHAYAKLGEKIYKAGEKERGKALLLKAIERSRKADPSPTRIANYATVGGELANIGEKDQAKSVLDEAFKEASALKDDAQRIALTTELAGKLVKVGEKDRAFKLFADNLKQVAKVESGTDRAALYYQIAGEYNEVSEGKFALEALGLARADAEKLATSPVSTRLTPEHSEKLSPLTGDGLLARIAGGYAGAGDFTTAEAIAGKIRDPHLRGIALAKMAGNQAQGGKKDKASETLTAALRLVNEAKDPLQKAEIFVAVGKAQIKAKDSASAVKAATEAEKLVPKLGSK